MKTEDKTLEEDKSNQGPNTIIISDSEFIFSGMGSCLLCKCPLMTSVLPGDVYFSVSLQSWFPFAKAFLTESSNFWWLGWSPHVSRQLLSLEAGSSSFSFLFRFQCSSSSPLSWPLNAGPHFSCLSAELYESREGWWLLNSRCLSPFSRKPSSQATVWATFTHTCAPPKREEGPSLLACIHQNKTLYDTIIHWKRWHFKV